MPKNGRFAKLSWFFVLFTISCVVSSSVVAVSDVQLQAEIYDYGIYEIQVRKIIIKDSTNTAGYRSHVKRVKDI